MKTLKGAVAMVMLAIFINCFSVTHAVPVESLQTFLIDADTVLSYPSFIHESATINDFTIHFGEGTLSEELLRVPIAAAGELTPQAKIRITVGMNPPAVDNPNCTGVGCIHQPRLSLPCYVSSPKTILIDPQTVKYYATFIDPSATINDLTIRFGTGYTNEELLRVPIAAPGELTPQAKIRITVGTNPPTSDNDPRVGITDGENRRREGGEGERREREREREEETRPPYLAFSEHNHVN